MTCYTFPTLGPKLRPLRSFAGNVMRISDDLRKGVVFIGHADGDAFTALGTGFFVSHSGARYLVTNQHVDIQLGDLPYSIRLNRTDGGSDTLQVDPIEGDLKWFAPTDSSVDLAVMPFEFDLRSGGYEHLFLNSRFFYDQKTEQVVEVGIGDVCYAVGLFRLLTGKRRNLPFVHTGNIALMPGEERVPVEDWLAPPASGKTQEIDCYLVELSNLKGLSGSPVYVRPTRQMAGLRTGDGSEVIQRSSDDIVMLLGVWSQSWDAPPGVALTFDRGSAGRVPLGVGCVVPAQKLRDLLESPELDADRAALKERWRLSQMPRPD